MSGTKYLNAGLSCIPVDVSTKQPTIQSWKKYQSELPDSFDDTQSVALVCGKVSGGLEILDFDNHDGEAFQRFTDFRNIEEVKEVLHSKPFVIETTQSGGFHVMFKSDQIGNNQKLARKKLSDNPLKIDTMIEVRGEGGYVVVAPSPGYKVQSGDICNIPHITEEERDILLTAAMSFNEYIPEPVKTATKHSSQSGERPGDEYNNTQDAINEAKTALIDEGWRSSNGKHWRRPDKKKGVSATFGHIASNIFYVFSTNAHPFDSEKAYTPFQIIALLKYRGDFTQCAKELVKRGYGQKDDTIVNKVRDTIRKGYYLTKQECHDLAHQFNIPKEKVVDVVEKANEDYKEEFGFDSMSDIQKAEVWLNQNYDFRGDVISKLPQMKKKKTSQWIDLNTDTLYREIQHAKIKFTFDKLKSLLKSDFVEDFNPFEDYFNNLPEWDGKDHIKHLASFIKTDNHDFFCDMLEKALVRNIACALIPDYYNRIVFTFISETQEIGKSWLINFINPFRSRYYTDEPLKDNKDSRFALTENFIYNLEELDQLNKTEVGHLKATISTRGVKDRVPYGTHKVYYPRCCSFWGSTNRREFLIDDKNTRWLCFYVSDIDWIGYSEHINIHDVWAQAWHLFNKKGYEYNLSHNEAQKRDALNEEYRVIDYEQSIISKHFETGNYDNFMSNADIMRKMVELTDNKVKLNTNPQKLGRLLSQLGYERTRSGNVRGWRIKIKEELMPF